MDKDRTDESTEKGKLRERKSLHTRMSLGAKYFRHCARVKEESLKMGQKKKKKTFQRNPSKVWIQSYARKELFKKRALRCEATILDFVIYLKKKKKKIKQTK